MKLICLTYAGGNATFYDQLQKELSKSVEVIALEYAGHGQRHKEPLYKTFDELSRDIEAVKRKTCSWRRLCNYGL